MDFKNKRITIMGIGILGGGLGTAQFFAERGAHVLVTDLKSPDELKDSIQQLAAYPIEYVLGEHRDNDFIETDMVVRNPAIPAESTYLKIARDHGVPVEMAESLFLRLSPTKQIIGVTGTRGKSTTSALIFHILKTAGKDVYLAGNQKNTSTLQLLNSVKKDSVVVLELSSWQLESFGWHTISPHIAVVTNVYPDHLNRYSSMEEYIQAKSNIFLFQNKEDYLVLNKNNQISSSFAPAAKSQIVWFSPKDWNDSHTLLLRGEHNRENAAAACAVCRLLDVTDEGMFEAFKTFTGLPGRLERISEVNGITIINDTTSTTPTAGIKALESFPEKKII
ncbi:MAG: UDP-N-acetylmuramoyl-L-alanine--D-glutamate ligase, partial [Candidatus Roizmanbacteria bacterium]|nr:UDP-N-acetylmuramoyl-L-alanine--D-glutamate ligase [Candidatus Roizmanbacteria bacterium]